MAVSTWQPQQRPCPSALAMESFPGNQAAGRVHSGRPSSRKEQSASTAALHMWPAVPAVGPVVVCAYVSHAASPSRMLRQRAAAR